MPARPRYAIRRADDPEGDDAAEIYALPHHGEVCLHARDADVIRRLEEAGLIPSTRPPFLDAADQGVHGGYRPRTQTNLFFAPPIENVAAAVRDALADAYHVEERETPAPS